jgi:hypothetical protein
MHLADKIMELQKELIRRESLKEELKTLKTKIMTNMQNKLTSNIIQHKS